MNNINETLENLRVRYLAQSLDTSDCDLNPEIQFKTWLDQAISSHCDEPNAFVLSTVLNDQPRARVVLLKGLSEGRFSFYTNYESAKGHEINHNQKACMTFLWLPLQRQIRIEGVITKLSDVESDLYFHKRPRGSQLGAVASPQSRKVQSRAELEKMFQETEEKFKMQTVIPRPVNWGGYGLRADYFEFWQGRDNRMHDRIAYQKNDQAWELVRLAP